MSDYKSIVLVIASVLKPVDDVRMYKKFAKSLVRTGKYEVNIVGFRSQSTIRDTSMCFHPLFAFSRLHWRRLIANYSFYRALKRLSPSILILTTPELYPAVWWYRKKFGGYLVYDIVENYSRNIRYNQGFASVIVAPLSRLLTSVERHLLASASLLISAEKGYIPELNLDPSCVQVIENKATTPEQLVDKKRDVNSPLSVIYTGTVSRVYGIKQALSIIETLIENENLPIVLTVLGHVPQVALHRELQNYAREHTWLNLRTKDHPVPHDDIIALIQQADFGIVSHQPIPSIAHCFPTRIWEYMAYRLPFLLQDHPYWTHYCSPWRCAIPIDFNCPAIETIKQEVLYGSFYPQGVPDEIYWKTEEKKLTSALENLICHR